MVSPPHKIGLAFCFFLILGSHRCHVADSALVTKKGSESALTSLARDAMLLLRPFEGAHAPSPVPLPPPPFGVISSRRSLARRAFNSPKWWAVALFFWVRAIWNRGGGESGSAGNRWAPSPLLGPSSFFLMAENGFCYQEKEQGIQLGTETVPACPGLPFGQGTVPAERQPENQLPCRD